MKALLDEHLSGSLAAELRSRGLDVEAVVERPELVGRSDDEIVDFASTAGRAVVTNNVKDFRPIAAARLADGRGHGGLILLPAKRSRTRAALISLADGIAAVMRANPDGIGGSERWVAPVAS